MEDFKVFLDKFKSKQNLYMTFVRLGLAKPIEKGPSIKKIGRRSRRKVARK